MAKQTCKRMRVKAEFLAATRKINGRRLTGEELLLLFRQHSTVNLTMSIYYINQVFKRRNEPKAPTSLMATSMEDMLKNRTSMIINIAKRNKPMKLP